MDKEQRAQPRKLLSYLFYIYHDDMERVAYLTRDLSLNGVFIEGDVSMYPIGTDVVVGFLLPGTRSEQEYQIEAVVARVNHEGAGLRFLNPDMETCNALLKLRDSA